MKREIKFRGRCIKSNDWVYGDLIHGVGHKSGNLYILPNKINLASVKHCNPLYGVKVDPETVGEYNGLNDKNGKEIYEGDILKIKWEKYSTGGYMQSSDSYVEYEEISTVEWMSIGWGFKKMDGKYFSLPKNSNLEVIGNIYETPQLLNND